MDKVKLVLEVKDNGYLEITLQRGGKVLHGRDLTPPLKNENIKNAQGSRFSRAGLTINKNLDTLLIVVIDNILSRNNIDRLSLKTLEIKGKVSDGAVSSMVIQTVKAGLGL